MIMEPSLSPVDAHFQHIPKQFTTCFLAKPSSQFMCVQLQFTVFWLAKPPAPRGENACLFWCLSRHPFSAAAPRPKLQGSRPHFFNEASMTRRKSSGSSAATCEDLQWGIHRKIGDFEWEDHRKTWTIHKWIYRNFASFSNPLTEKRKKATSIVLVGYSRNYVFFEVL